ncbi:hypothetical protein ABIB40_000298 [Pedobacter sp. UYP30]|uniref:hypothetical protein n=1 Tax=Pedobacter sp. UYP30 TaxID=1756400 RepID=UPI00339AA5C7
MTYNTFRENDMRRERILSEFLDRKLYNQSLFINALRTNTIEDQFAGSDIVSSIPTKGLNNIIIDEKAQLYYLEGGLPTFAFELNFINKRGERVEGWLTDKSKKTAYYQLLFLTAKKDFDSIDDIYKVEYVLVKRSAILQAINLDLETLRNKGKEVARNSEFHQFKDPDLSYYFTHSTKLAESPVNVILRKQKLIEICCLHGSIE